MCHCFGGGCDDTNSYAIQSMLETATPLVAAGVVCAAVSNRTPPAQHQLGNSSNWHFVLFLLFELLLADADASAGAKSHT